MFRNSLVLYALTAPFSFVLLSLCFLLVLLLTRVFQLLWLRRFAFNAARARLLLVLIVHADVKAQLVGSSTHVRVLAFFVKQGIALSVLAGFFLLL